jgi:hypothetical protein
LSVKDDSASFILDDDGLGFDTETLQHPFERRVKGKDSAATDWAWHSSILSRVHGGTIAASNR